MCDKKVARIVLTLVVFNSMLLYSLAAPTTTHSRHALLPNTTAKFNLKWTPRSAWQASPARLITSINGGVAVSHVIIHHTATPTCHDTSTSTSTSGNGNGNTCPCCAAVRAMQRYHQQDHGWDDIGYNFLIGGEQHAEIYEGRGFNVSGAHAPGYNARSLGVALIGDWSVELPSRSMLDKVNQLISYGIEHGYIQSNYTLLGHRQVKATECPGTRLYNEIKLWPHFKATQ